MLKGPQGLVYKKKEASVDLSQFDLEEGELIVFQSIKEADNNGIWTKDIKSKTGLHQAVLTKTLRALENKRLIKAIKSVKNSTRKVYILYWLQPSADLTGGPWFSENELDTEFIERLSQVCYRYLLSRTVLENSNCIIPKDSKRFPTLDEIFHFICNGGFLNAEITIDNLSTILDRLVFDGIVQKIYSRQDWPHNNEPLITFKAKRGHLLSSQLGSIPCGFCPVRKICREMGPVVPARCVYFRDWLSVPV